MGIRTSYKTLHTITRCILVAIMIAILIFELPVTAQTNSVYFPVGLGFTDVIPHQIVRLADDRVVIIAAKAQSVAQLEIYWTTVAGLPAQTSDFGGKLEVALPNAPISVDAVYDGSTTIHVLMNTLNGTIYDYPFDTSTNQVHPIISVATGSAAISGDYLGTSGISGAVDLSGTLHIAYWQNGNHIIHRAYTYSTAANTLTPLGAAFQVDTNGRANHPSLAVSPFDNSLTVGWVSEVGTPTRILVRVRASSGTWGSEEIVSNQPVWKSTNFGINIDQGPVIVIGTDGTKHLTYIKDFDPTQYGRVHYAVRHVGDTAWTDNELNTYSHDPAPAIDSAGQLYIIGHGPESTNQNDDMYYMKQNPDGSWAPITLFALHQGNNYLDSSPSVKWSAIGWNRPEAVEFLFFAANNGLYTNTTIYYARLPITAPTPTPTPSLTPTDTLTPTLTNTPTDTPTSTESPTPSNTPLPSDTPTPSLTPSNTTTPVDTATSPPTNTPPSTPTNTSTATSTPTATATATATLTPIATNTPIATVGPQTITVQISTGNDDVNEDIINNATVFTASGSTVWIGTGTSTTVSYTGLRFNSIVIPRGSTITTARLEFYSTSAQWQQVTLQVAAELSANSAAFSSTSRPSQRPLTIARVSHSSNVNWAINTWYQFDPMLAVVQEVINQSSWQSGNSMSLILHGTGSAFGRKNVRSYEGGATTAARLVISFSAPAVTAIPSPLPSPTLTPSFTPTATPTSTPTTTPTATNTATNTATSTSTSTPMPTNTATYTPTPTDTPTNTATPTDTATYTPIPSNTPTNTATFTLTPSNTPTNTATFTLTPSNTPTSTDTPTPTPTNSATPSNTPTLTLTPSTTPTNTATFTLTPSNTPTATYTPTDTPTPTPTNSATPSNTPTLTLTPSNTPTDTLTPSNTPTSTYTPRPTPTDTPTFTLTPSNTPSATPTMTPSFTPSNTPSATPTMTPSFTPSNTPTNTPSATPTLTPSFMPTSTPSSTPTATRTPIPTNTPTFTPSFTPTATSVPVGGTITIQINAAADDVNEVNATTEPSGATVWLGNGGTAVTSFTGLRFNNVTIPPHATITSAHLEFYSTQSQWISISFQMAADAADSSAPFTAANRPGLRTLTAARVSHSSNISWAANTWYSLEEIRTVVEEVVNRLNWRNGNSLSIILSGTGSNWGRKFFRSFEGGATFAVRLVITYTT